MRLTHSVQNVAGAVLRRHFQLAGNVVLHQLFEEGVVGILHHVIVPDPRADEHPLNPRKRPDLPQKLQIIPLVGIQSRTGSGCQALSSHAKPLFLLFFAGGVPEVGSGAANVVDVALEIRKGGQELCFFQHRFLTADGDLPPLMKGDGAEVAVTEAPPVVGDGEFHLRQAGNAAFDVVHGVPPAGIGQGINVVQLLRGQDTHGGILD